MNAKEYQIKTIYLNGSTAGFIARRRVIKDFIQEIPDDGWMCTPCIDRPKWQGNYPTRKQAAQALVHLLTNKEK